MKIECKRRFQESPNGTNDARNYNKKTTEYYAEQKELRKDQKTIEDKKRKLFDRSIKASYAKYP